MRPEVCQIPLRRRDQTVAAHALIDPDDFERVNALTWCLAGDGYVFHTTPEHTTVMLHRFVLGLAPKWVDPHEVDHENRDRLDCRKSNLRIATRAENCQNQAPKGRSSYRGVLFDARENTWRARVRMVVDGQQRTLLSRRFRSELDAAIAAERVRLEHMPFATPDPRLAQYMCQEAI